MLAAIISSQAYWKWWMTWLSSLLLKNCSRQEFCRWNLCLACLFPWLYPQATEGILGSKESPGLVLMTWDLIGIPLFQFTYQVIVDVFGKVTHPWWQIQASCLIFTQVLHMFWGRGSRVERKILMFVEFKYGTTLVCGYSFSRSDLWPFRPMMAVVGEPVPVSGCFFLYVHSK